MCGICGKVKDFGFGLVHTILPPCGLKWMMGDQSMKTGSYKVKGALCGFVKETQK